MGHIELDPASPKAQQAAERARETLTARLSDDSEFASRVINEDIRTMRREDIAYLIAAYTALLANVLDAYADDLAKFGYPLDRAAIFAAIAPRIAAQGLTI